MSGTLKGRSNKTTSVISCNYQIETGLEREYAWLQKLSIKPIEKVKKRNR